MTVEAKTFSDPSRSHPPRRIRNYLLEPKFQLKYSGMVVAVTVVVASVLGYQAYRYSTGQTQLLNMQRMEARGTAVDQQFTDALDRYAREADRRVVFGILGGIAMLAFALGITGIVITHRVVGPCYRLKRLFSIVGAGRIQAPSALRRHDELRDVFDAFQEMLRNLRNLREQDVRELDSAMDQARAAGVPDAAIAGLKTLRERIQRSLE